MDQQEIKNSVHLLKGLVLCLCLWIGGEILVEDILPKLKDPVAESFEDNKRVQALYVNALVGCSMAVEEITSLGLIAIEHGTETVCSELIRGRLYIEEVKDRCMGDIKCQVKLGYLQTYTAVKGRVMDNPDMKKVLYENFDKKYDLLESIIKEGK